MKLKSCCTTEEMVSNLKRPSTEWVEKKGLITRIYSELKKTKLSQKSMN
jgi:hypothetical protein